MQNMKFCQSCGMPMEGAVYGTERDGTKNEEYCSYCYQNGAFTADCTMEQMIEFCAAPMVEFHPELTKEAAMEQMRQFFPQLKRWK